MTRCILQDWVLDLPGLRHQGVLVCAVRGCDTAPKNDVSKSLARSMREVVLNAFVGDSTKALTFIEKVSDEELQCRMRDFLHSLDQYPLHYVMHVIYAAEIIGYFYRGDNSLVQNRWAQFYGDACHKLHLYPESKIQLNIRLLKNETEFFEAQSSQTSVCPNEDDMGEYEGLDF
jgi:hypothetical protein